MSKRKGANILSTSLLCDICLEIFLGYDNLLKHRKNVHQLHEFVCFKCNSFFGRVTDYKSHSCHTSTVYPCEVCLVSFVSFSGLWYHKRLQHPKVRKCPHCDKVFQKSELAEFHSHRQEHKESKFVCRICQKQLSTLGSLTIHMKIHEGRDVFFCSQCNQKFAHACTLKRHVNSVHEGQVNIFLCEICGKNVSSSTKLRQHIMMHKGIKPHVCTFCQKAFTKLEVLKLHLRVHTKEKPFKCEFCDKLFAQQAQRNMHIKTVHLDDRPFECNVCQKAYQTQGLLNQHVRLHMKRPV